MTTRKEQEFLLQEIARQDLAAGKIDRREFLTRSLLAGLGLAGVGAVAKGVIGSGWHSGITAKAGVPDAAPATWDDFLAAGKKIVDSNSAPWGATFDSHGWRSLAPVTHSMSTNVYTPEGLFDFTSEPAIEALKLMKQIMTMANPDILLEGASDAGVNGKPDEV